MPLASSSNVSAPSLLFDKPYHLMGVRCKKQNRVGEQGTASVTLVRVSKSVAHAFMLMCE